jgi:hypothetical protein
MLYVGIVFALLSAFMIALHRGYGARPLPWRGVRSRGFHPGCRILPPAPPTMHLLNATRRLPLVLAALTLAACSDANPVRPVARAEPGPETLQTTLDCTVSMVTGALTCGDAPSTGGASGVILGGQGVNLLLASSNPGVAADTFSIDVEVTNLIPQPLGTTDGATADPAGIRVFFFEGPIALPGGTATVANPDGIGAFTDMAQPYYQYNGVLSQNSASAAKKWKFQITPEVTSFNFRVLISTQVQYPQGYIDNHYYVLTLNPGETRTLPGTVRRVNGGLYPDQAIDWVSASPALAAVTGTQVTAGASNGFTEITGTSGPRPGVYTTAVSVCPATLVTSGTSLPSSISSSDCFSSYGNPNGRPSTSYYADLFRVALTAGQTITVTMDSGDDLDTYLLLAGPTVGELVAGNDDDDEGALGVGSRLVYTATVSGVYVIEASTFNGLDTGNYTLGVTIS